jgi:hypothetical protein
MFTRVLQSVFSALIVVALVGVPVFALHSDTPAAQPPAPAQLDPDDDGLGACHGIQRAYWAVTSNPGVGEGKEQAATDLAAAAAERDCELSDAPPDWFRGGGRPEWAGGPPPWAGEGRGDGADDNGNGPPWATEVDGPPWGPPPWAGGTGGRPSWAGGDDDGEGRGGPPWATEGDGPPWGMAWGYWLENDVERACARIRARMEAHPNASVPEDLRGRIESELGCNLPD